MHLHHGHALLSFVVSLAVRIRRHANEARAIRITAKAVVVSGCHGGIAIRHCSASGGTTSMIMCASGDQLGGMGCQPSGVGWGLRAGSSCCWWCMAEIVRHTIWVVASKHCNQSVQRNSATGVRNVEPATTAAQHDSPHSTPASHSCVQSRVPDLIVQVLRLASSPEQSTVYDFPLPGPGEALHSHRNSEGAKGLGEWVSGQQGGPLSRR